MPSTKTSTKRRLEGEFDKPGKRTKTAFAGVVIPMTMGGNPAKVNANPPHERGSSEMGDSRESVDNDAHSVHERGSSAMSENRDNVNEVLNSPHERGSSTVTDNENTTSDVEEVPGGDGVKMGDSERKKAGKRNVKVKVRAVGVRVDVVVDGLEDAVVDVKVGRWGTRGDRKGKLKLEEVDVKPKLE